MRMNLKEMGVSTRNLINSTKDRDYWRALVNVPLNLLFFLAHRVSSEASSLFIGNT